MLEISETSSCFDLRILKLYFWNKFKKVFVILSKSLLKLSLPLIIMIDRSQSVNESKLSPVVSEL